MAALTIDALFKRYRSEPILIDSNLLLVYFVGLFDLTLLSRFERTRAFAEEDFALLIRFVTSFPAIVTTPNVLTEVSNLSNKLVEGIRLAYLSSLIQRIKGSQESYLPSAVLSQDPGFCKFGLTDVSIIQASEGKHLILTDDFRLSNYLAKQGRAVVNFNHLRQISWSQVTL